MPEATLHSPDESGQNLIAPLWHTVVVVLILLGFSALGARSHSAFGVRRHGRVAGYITAALFEWLVVAFIWFGLRLRRNNLGKLLGQTWLSWKRLFQDLGLAVIFLVTSNIILAGLAVALKAKPSQALRSLFPKGPAEIVAFLLLSLTAGICEEIIFRGYLQRQLTLLSKSAATGVIIQGILFGCAHGYQGSKYMAMISVYGCLFGVMAYWRRSLLPGMTAHFLQDGVLGLLVGLAQR